MKAEEIRRTIEDSPLAGRVEEIMALARPAVRMHSYLVEVDDLPPGASRMGGAPDLPPDMPWPQIGRRPVEFLAQIDLAEAAQAFALPDIPTSGWLALFCDVEGLYGSSDLEPDLWRMLFFEGNTTSLRRREYPGKAADRFNFCELRLEREDCVPDLTDVGGELTDDLWEICSDLNERINSAEDGYPVHRLGGYPMLIQSFLNDFKKWDFLLQIDSDEEPGWMWGDKGRLYGWIKARHLKRRAFGKVRWGEEFY